MIMVIILVLLCYHMNLITGTPVFGASDLGRPKPTSSATKMRWKFEILPVERGVVTEQPANDNDADQNARLHMAR